MENGAAESWTSPITNRPTKQNPSPSHPRNGAGGGGRLDEGSPANGEGKGMAESLPRKDEEDGKTTETLGEGGRAG